MTRITPTTASQSFVDAAKVPDRLLAIERDGQWGAGSPARQRALRGGAVVLTVAAWQAFVEDTARAVLVGTSVKAGERAKHLGELAASALDDSIERFNTPNRENVARLFEEVGLTLGTGWTVSDGAGVLTNTQAFELVNAWLNVRHSVAHGVPFHKNSKLMNLRLQPHVASRVVTGKMPGRGNGLALNREDPSRCADLFRALHYKVTEIAKQHLKSI